MESHPLGLSHPGLSNWLCWFGFVSTWVSGFPSDIFSYGLWRSITDFRKITHSQENIHNHVMKLIPFWHAEGDSAIPFLLRGQADLVRDWQATHVPWRGRDPA